MPNTGSRSVFDLTHRDTLPNPGAALDADLLNRASDSLIRLEEWAQNAITLVPQESKTPALVFAVHHWLWTCDGTKADVLCTLPIAAAFLEDIGVLPYQQNDPDNPTVSLAQGVSLSVPSYMPGPILTAAQAALRSPQPAWVNQMKGLPLASFSVRLPGASGTDVFHMERPVYFDLGDGVSPCVTGHIFYSTPPKRLNFVPAGTYEICLLALSWTR